MLYVPLMMDHKRLFQVVTLSSIILSKTTEEMYPSLFFWNIRVPQNKSNNNTFSLITAQLCK